MKFLCLSSCQAMAIKMTSRSISCSRPALHVDIPLDKIDFSFVRSSGPLFDILDIVKCLAGFTCCKGGQNVNKVNTKAELRFNVMSASWIPEEARLRLAEQQSHRINNCGEIIISSQEQRSQTRNKADCIKKLKQFVDLAMIEPKTREQWEGIGEKGKAERKKEKKHRKNIKSKRRGGDFY